jgi:hypothetical protein
VQNPRYLASILFKNVSRCRVLLRREKERCDDAHDSSFGWSIPNSAARERQKVHFPNGAKRPPDSSPFEDESR